MVHDYNIQEKKQELVVKMNQDSQIKVMKNNIISSINSLKDEILNPKEIIIKNLQNDNEKHKQKCEQLQRYCGKYKYDDNPLVQCGCHNNIILSGIPNSVSADILDESVISVLAKIDIFVEQQGIEACHIIGKPDRPRPKKTNVQFI